MRLDSHHHFWRYNPLEYDWIDESQSLIRRDFLPENLGPEMRASNVTGAISVQARQTLEETYWLLELAEQHEFIQGVVGWVPLTDPDLERLLAQVAGHAKLRSVRHVLQDEPDPNFMLRADFNAGIRAVTRAGLAYDILVFERHLPQTIRFVDSHPGQTFVLDHLAKPRVRDGEISPWRENIRELAKRPNVYCKLSGLVTEADYASWTTEHLMPYVEVALSAFGAGRLMFGSDWPVCLPASSYPRWISAVEEMTSTLSPEEQEQIWFETAKKAYRLL